MVEEKVKKWRKKIIVGTTINLVPMSEKYLKNVVNLRNNERQLYYFGQDKKITLDDQLVWYTRYLERDNDIYWAILDKKKRFIGTIRLYEISEKSCDQGSFMIDEKYACMGPYAMEAELLSLDFAFNELEVSRVINENREDNKNMNSITRKLGFEFKKDVTIRGMRYKYYELTPELYKREKIASVIDYWGER